MSWKKSKFFVCIFVCLSITLVQFIILWKKHRRYISRPEGSKARLLVVLYFSQKYNLNGCFRYHCDDNGDVRSWARGMFNYQLAEVTWMVFKALLSNCQRFYFFCGQCFGRFYCPNVAIQNLSQEELGKWIVNLYLVNDKVLHFT